MSIASKQMLCESIESRIGEVLTSATTRDAMQLIADVLAEYDIEHINTAEQAADDFLNAFLDAKEIEGRSPKTLNRYRRLLTRLIREIHAPIRQITTYHLRSYLMHEKQRGLSDRTLEGMRSVISSFFGWLWKEGMIEHNPCANIGPIKYKKEIRLPFTNDEIERLKESCDNLRDKVIICFLLSTGCRISEACSVDRLDINFDTKECTVLGKGNKERTVYIDAVTAMQLKRYLRQRRDDSPALFVGKGSDRLTPGGIRRQLHMIESRACVENVHPHRFRRTLATNLINRGMPIQEVASILGHDKIDTTMTYVYIDKDNVKNAYRKYA